MEPLVVVYPRNYYRNALWSAAVFPLVGIAIAVALVTIGPGECPGRSAAESSPWTWVPFVGLFGGCGLFLAMLAYLDAREVRWDEVSIEPGRIVFRRQGLADEVAVGQIRRAIWRCRPRSGSLVLETEREKQVVRFDLVPRELRVAVIERLCDVLPAEVQQDWPDFCRMFAVPLLRSLEPGRPLREDEQLMTRRRFDLLFGTAAVVYAVCAVFVWRVTGSPRIFMAPLALLIPWLFLRFAWPKKGVRAKRTAGPPGDLAPPVGICIALISFFGGAIVLALLLDPLSPTAKQSVLVASWIAPLGIASAMFLRTRRARREWWERRREEAVAEWEARPAESGG